MHQATAGRPTHNSADRPEGWWKSSVVYQIYPRSFADSNGDGIGDIPGITAKVGYLHRLGIDVVWLSPVYRSPMDDNGYDISDYQDVDPLFGTIAELDELIAELHSRGMKLVMDLVVNHTSDEHPWFIESRDAASPKRNWYWWLPPRDGFEPGGEGAEPTNWGSAFSGSAWKLDEASGEYFLHMFSPKQPDLNWENPDVRHAVYEMMNWWVDRGVDGFRMDVINLISKPTWIGDGPVGPDTKYSSCFAAIENGHRLNEFLAEMNAAVGLSERRLITVGEMPGSTIESARAVTDPANRELDMVFTFEHVGLDARPGGSKFDLHPLTLPALKQNLNAWQVGLADVGWNSLYWDNHDQPRAVSRFGDDSPEHRINSAKTLATVQHMHRGTPYVYQGEELGMTNTYFTHVDQYQDIESVNYHADAISLGLEAETVMAGLAAKSRDNARTPMQWDDSLQAGFTDGIPWLPVNPNYVTINAAAAEADPNSVFHHFRRLIELRRTHPVLVEGRFKLLLPDHEQIWAVTRTLGDQVLVMVANCSSEPTMMPLAAVPDLAEAQILLATHGPATLERLEPWESRIYLLDSGNDLAQPAP
ncbi:alpha-glucosidase [Humibacillus xanthopallidus]|uniref:Oligo-1,6-glucosidase n=1 Tax=Humibacillus xanthopallidus TaxID=412689 RepID=A0A543HZK3_9MICO|nr:alpha-glucosidase [Humibacillus xanthopallidus]TQM63759.1 oligo-1,6-glucosidase [Humibacillus xanthopallidus]